MMFVRSHDSTIGGIPVEIFPENGRVLCLLGLVHGEGEGVGELPCRFVRFSRCGDRKRLPVPWRQAVRPALAPMAVLRSQGQGPG